MREKRLAIRVCFCFIKKPSQQNPHPLPQLVMPLHSRTYSGTRVHGGEPDGEIIGTPMDVVEYPDIYGTRFIDGLVVGPAIGSVGALARAKVTFRLWPFQPLVDSRSEETYYRVNFFFTIQIRRAKVKG